MKQFLILPEQQSQDHSPTALDSVKYVQYVQHVQYLSSIYCPLHKHFLHMMKKINPLTSNNL
jgi:hypothetical protein